MLAALNRFFANELVIDAIVSRPWLTCVAMPVLLVRPLVDVRCNACPARPSASSICSIVLDASPRSSASCASRLRRPSRKIFVWRTAKQRGHGIDRRHAESSRRAGRDRGCRDDAATGGTPAGKSGPGKRLALRVWSGKKKLLITRNDIAGFVH
jgi:hypothetical protein